MSTHIRLLTLSAFAAAILGGGCDRLDSSKSLQRFQIVTDNREATSWVLDTRTGTACLLAPLIPKGDPPEARVIAMCKPWQGEDAEADQRTKQKHDVDFENRMGTRIASQPTPTIPEGEVRKLRMPTELPEPSRPR